VLWKEAYANLIEAAEALQHAEAAAHWKAEQAEYLKSVAK
jgi:hypothetical protein